MNVRLEPDLLETWFRCVFDNGVAEAMIGYPDLYGDDNVRERIVEILVGRYC